jgi:RES domain
MASKTSTIGGRYLRVADPEWVDPLDATYAALGDGQRWNPPGLACLYLNADEKTARANVDRLYEGLPYSAEDLDPDEAPLLVEVDIPEGTAVDAYSGAGLSAAGLPATFPRDALGNLIPHATCQPIGAAAFASGLDGVDARSAASGGDRELAWFPRSHAATKISVRQFQDWY